MQDARGGLFLNCNDKAVSYVKVVPAYPAKLPRQVFGEPPGPTWPNGGCMSHLAGQVGHATLFEILPPQNSKGGCMSHLAGQVGHATPLKFFRRKIRYFCHPKISHKIRMGVACPTWPANWDMHPPLTFCRHKIRKGVACPPWLASFLCV